MILMNSLKDFPQAMKKFDRMLSMGKSVGHKCGLGYTHEHTTNTFSQTMFVNGNTNSSPPQESISPTKAKNAKGRHSKKNVIKETQANHDMCYTCGEYGHHSIHYMKNRDVLNKKLLHLTNQSKTLNHQVINFYKLLERSSQSKHMHAS